MSKAKPPEALGATIPSLTSEIAADLPAAAATAVDSQCHLQLAGEVSFVTILTLNEKSFYTIALDESTDSTDMAQLAIFIQGIDNEFNITEDLVLLVPLLGH
ncbi:hypothetical protein J437_LFUL007052 [Ladona fulva]|uniref:Uncharacterized protein n=1 Tax=Ladona fulva TaxID=123851 RepID=A0A8K0K8Z4_LADFU|nr:hypothetical protein J437_LFUL007052 [Ladona fulva]